MLFYSCNVPREEMLLVVKDDLTAVKMEYERDKQLVSEPLHFHAMFTHCL